MTTAQKPRLSLYLLLVIMVLGSNTLLYRLDVMQPVPNLAALGSLFDCIIVVPLLTYFFIIRKRYKVKNTALAVIAGYAAATFIIPRQHLEAYSFVKYILFAGEGAFVLIELYIVLKFAAKIPFLIKRFHTNPGQIPAFPYRLERVLAEYFKPSRMIDIYTTEVSIYFYSLFSWKKKVPGNVSTFTFHKRTSGVALYLMLIHALLIESIGLHVLLHEWIPLVSYVALFLNVYTLLLFLAEIQAIRLVPFIFTNQKLYMQVGVMKRLAVPFTEIKSIRPYTGPEKLSKEEAKVVFDGVVADFMKEKPLYEIEFRTPQEVRLLYGFKKMVTKAHVRPDESQAFYEAVCKHLPN